MVDDVAVEVDRYWCRWVIPLTIMSSYMSSWLAIFVVSHFFLNDTWACVSCFANVLSMNVGAREMKAEQVSFLQITEECHDQGRRQSHYDMPAGYILVILPMVCYYNSADLLP